MFLESCCYHSSGSTTPCILCLQSSIKIQKLKRNTNCNVISTYLVPVQALEAQTFFSQEEEKV